MLRNKVLILKDLVKEHSRQKESNMERPEAAMNSVGSTTRGC